MYLELNSFWFYVESCITLPFTTLYIGFYCYLELYYTRRLGPVWLTTRSQPLTYSPNQKNFG